MTQYKAWQAPFYSFWSKPFYIDVAKNWKGLGYGYLFLLICFTSLCLCINITMDLGDSEEIERVAVTVPPSERVTKREYVTKEGKHVTKIERVTVTATTVTTTKRGGQHWGVDLGSTNEENSSLSSKKHYATRFSLMDFVAPADTDIESIIKQIPTKTTIEKGILSINCPSPRTVNDLSGQPIVTFDTRNNSESLNVTNNSLFLLSRNTLFIKRPLTVESDIDKLLRFHYTVDFSQKIPLSSIGSGYLEFGINKSANNDHWFTDFKKAVVATAYVILVPLAFIFCVVQSLIYGLIGIIIAKLSKLQMSYGTLVRLSAVSLTPVLLIDSLLRALNLDSQLWGFLAFIASIGYLVFAIRANITPSEQKSVIA